MTKLIFNRKQIIQALEEKGANNPCHRCGNKTFAVIDGFARYHLSDYIDANELGGRGVPTFLVGCNNCGAITPHAALALLGPKIKDKEGDENGK